MKVPPEMSRQRIDGSSPQIEVTGLTSGDLELCQKRRDIPNGIQHMTTNDDLSRKIIGSILPGSGDVRNVCYSLFCSILTQIVQHRDTRLNSSNMLGLCGQRQGKTP